LLGETIELFSPLEPQRPDRSDLYRLGTRGGRLRAELFHYLVRPVSRSQITILTRA